MRTRTGAVTFSFLFSTLFAAGAFAADSIGETGRSAGGKNPLKKVYFGEQHMHTRNAFDAFTAGVTATWEDAYNFAKGKEIKPSTSGEPIKQRTPYDVVAITDHPEYYGDLKEFLNPESDLSKSDCAKQVVADVWAPENTRPAIFDAIKRRETFGTISFRIASMPDHCLSAVRPASGQEGGQWRSE
jgi:hypothetical protein